MHYLLPAVVFSDMYTQNIQGLRRELRNMLYKVPLYYIILYIDIVVKVSNGTQRYCAQSNLQGGGTQNGLVGLQFMVANHLPVVYISVVAL
jgi:hypothetical protein